MEGFVHCLLLLLCICVWKVGCDQWYYTQKSLHAQFETAEHAYLGDQIVLQYPDHRINGRDFDFKIGAHSLSYGFIIALAGDYFGNWKLRGCPPQVSDGYDQDPHSSVQRFRQIAESMLEQGTEKVLDCITAPIEEMNGRICKAVHSGQDPVQAYRNISEDYDNRFGLCTHTGYLQLSLCNWDHFGQDAVNAYKAGHAAALAVSAQASEGRNVSALQHAYFLEAYAQHFLTDLFSAGHLRTPRRLLHQSIESINNPWPADKVNREMHDEDSAAGLWVTNQFGEGWAVYGDKELSSAKSYKNVDQAVTAIRLGIDEVWEAFRTGVKRSVDTYQALRKAPDLHRLRSLRNFTPLFAPSNKSEEVLQGRSDFSSRASSSLTDYAPSDLNQSRWESILNAIQKSGPRASAFPATLDGLLPEVKLDQYQIGNSSQILINRYGPMTSQNYRNRSLNFCHLEPELGERRRLWNMLLQEHIPLPKLLAKAEWDYLASFDEDRAILLGTDHKRTVNVYAGMQGGHLSWVQYSKEDLSGMVSRVVQFGRFGKSSETIFMVEERKMADHTEFRVRTFDDGVYAQPQMKRDMWTTVPSIISFSYRSHVEQSPEIHLSIGYDSRNQSLVSTLTSWPSHDFTRRNLEVIESGILDPPNVILLDGRRIARIYYGSSANATTFKLETLRIRLLSTSGSPRPELLSSQTFPITWNASSKYTSFSFLTTHEHSSSLVVLLEDPETAASSTLVFPRGSANDFLAPIVSPVKVPLGVPTVTAPFLKSLYVQQVPYIDRRTGRKTSGGLLQLLDNFGILGARLLALDPDREQLSYKVVGQVPAIAGQTSDAIGWNFKMV